MGFDFVAFWNQNQKIILAALFFLLGLGLIYGGFQAACQGSLAKQTGIRPWCAMDAKFSPLF